MLGDAYQLVQTKEDDSLTVVAKIFKLVSDSSSATGAVFYAIEYNDQAPLMLYSAFLCQAAHALCRFSSLWSNSTNKKEKIGATLNHGVEIPAALVMMIAGVGLGLNLFNVLPEQHDSIAEACFIAACIASIVPALKETGFACYKAVKGMQYVNKKYFGECCKKSPRSKDYLPI